MLNQIDQSHYQSAPFYRRDNVELGEGFLGNAGKVHFMKRGFNGQGLEVALLSKRHFLLYNVTLPGTLYTR